jgi:carbon starvation protein
MYLVVWFMRVASAEFIGDRILIMKNAHVGSIVALVFSAILIWTGFWARIWVLFGGANQLMASLALLIVSLWLVQNRKNFWWAFIPFVFMFVIAGLLAVILILSALVLAFDGVRALMRARAEQEEPVPAA